MTREVKFGSDRWKSISEAPKDALERWGLTKPKKDEDKMGCKRNRSGRMLLGDHRDSDFYTSIEWKAEAYMEVRRDAIER